MGLIPKWLCHSTNLFELVDWAPTGTQQVVPRRRCRLISDCSSREIRTDLPSCRKHAGQEMNRRVMELSKMQMQGAC